MSYKDDISALGATHHWDFDGDSLDQIGSADGTDTSILYTSNAIAEDATNCATTNASGDRISIPTTTDINNSAQTRKIVGGWFMATSIQTPPRRIYGEGDQSTAFQFICAYGNSSMFEVIEPTNFAVQIYGIVLQPNRIYHLLGIFSGNAYDNKIYFYIDGIAMTSSNPSNPAPGTTDLDSRGVAEFGDPAGTAGVAGSTITLTANIDGKYNHWATWDGANAELTSSEIREELFEKGVLPTITIGSGSQSVMQTSLNTYSDTIRADAPLCIRINTVTGDGDFTLSADNITFNKLASIHIQYMGTGTLIWRNTNGSDASIISTPNGGSIIITTVKSITITVKNASTLENIQNAVVYIKASTGGDLVAGTTIVSALTNSSGIVTTNFDYTSDQPIIGYVRKGTNSPYFIEGTISGTITTTGLNQTTLLISDE